MNTEEMKAQLIELIGVANVAALEAWLVANELSIVRMSQSDRMAR